MNDATTTVAVATFTGLLCNSEYCLDKHTMKTSACCQNNQLRQSLKQICKKANTQHVKFNHHLQIISTNFHLFSQSYEQRHATHTASPSYSILQMSLLLFLLLPWSSISEWRYCVARHLSHCHAVCVSATVKAISCIQCSLVLIIIINIIHPSRILWCWSDD